MKRKALAAIMAAAMALSMVGCGGSTSESTDSTKTTEKTEATEATEATDSAASTDGTVENKDKPLCWFNRQPSSSATGETGQRSSELQRKYLLRRFRCKPGC